MNRAERRKLKREKPVVKQTMMCLRCKEGEPDCCCIYPLPSSDRKTHKGMTLPQILKMEYRRAVSSVSRR